MNLSWKLKCVTLLNILTEADRQRTLEQRRAQRRQRKPEVSNRSNNARTFSDNSSPERAAGVKSSSNPSQKDPPQVGGSGAMDAPTDDAAAPRLGRRGSDDMYPREKGVFAPPSRRISDLSAHSSLASGPLHHIHGGPALGTPLYEEDDDEDNGTVTSWSRENTGASSGDSLGLLPWHHQQLYRLYGKQAADEFLYPKFEDKKRTVAPKAVNPKLCRQGGAYHSSKGLFTLQALSHKAKAKTKTLKNKKVLLRERKRHTARRVASCLHPVLMGVAPPPPQSAGWRYPPSARWGYPLPSAR